MAKVIGVQPSDTFISADGGIVRIRGKVANKVYHEKIGRDEDASLYRGAIIETDRAMMWLRGMGYEVTNATPTPTYPVVRVAELTHAIQFPEGCVSQFGDQHTVKSALPKIQQDLATSGRGEQLQIVALDWTGVGGIDDATLKAALSVPIPPSPSPFPRKQPAPLASNDNYTPEDGRPAPFKVGDVVRGMVVGEWLAVRNKHGKIEENSSGAIMWHEHQRELAEGYIANFLGGRGTVVRVAVVEVSEVPQ